MSVAQPENEVLLGRYRLVSALGQGGMAEVFLAKSAGAKGFEKTLVVKRILPQWAEDPQFIEMFLSEAKLAAQLNHPNIVQIFDFGEADGEHFIAMEHVDGPNLRTLTRQAKTKGVAMPYPVCAKIASLACEGLEYAHALTDPETGAPLHLIHRDISLDNILLARNGSVKLVDFGIAKAATQTHHTQTGIKKGKVAYMAPEIFRDEPLDHRADIFALGVVLYVLIAGRRPFKADNDATLMQAIVYQPAIPLDSIRADVPEALKRIVDKAMAKDRTQRYQSCREMQMDLDRFLHDEGDPVGAFQLAQLYTKLGPYPPPLVKHPSRVGIQARASPGSGVSAQVGTPGAGQSPGTGAGQSPGLTPGTGSGQHHSSPVQAGGVPPGWRIPLIAGGLLLLATWGVLLARVMADRTPAQAPQVAVVPAPPQAIVPQPAPPAVVVAPEPAPEPRPPPEVDVRIQAQPRSAVIELDGERLAANPFVGKLPVDERTHELRISAPGHVSVSRRIQLDRDTMLDFSLERQVAERVVRRTVYVRQAAPAASTSPAADAAPQAPDITELPAKPARNVKNKRSLDTDNPFNDSKRKLDTDNPWNK